MDLFRVHAYAIDPSGPTDDDLDPKGGAVQVSADLRAAIESNVQVADFDQQIPVDFRMDEETRHNAVRALILDFAFGEPPTASAAARQLARRLVEAMDGRSKICLFVPTAMQEGARRRVTLWIFPRDDAFRFSSGARGARIHVLTDVFVQKSRLRKAAKFEGRNTATDFLSGMVLDFQSPSHDAADFWTYRFLECNLGIAGETGSRMLAKIVRKVSEACTDREDREQLHAAIMAIRSAPSRRTSLRKFADTYLSGEVHSAFIQAANPQALNASFNFQRTVFDEMIKFRIFELRSGVFVSAPFDQVGEAVQVNRDHTRLRCEGEIVEEKVRSRHA